MGNCFGKEQTPNNVAPYARVENPLLMLEKYDLTERWDKNVKEITVVNTELTGTMINALRRDNMKSDLKGSCKKENSISIHNELTACPNKDNILALFVRNNEVLAASGHNDLHLVNIPVADNTVDDVFKRYRDWWEDITVNVGGSYVVGVNAQTSIGALVRSRGITMNDARDLVVRSGRVAYINKCLYTADVVREKRQEVVGPQLARSLLKKVLDPCLVANNPLMLLIGTAPNDEKDKGVTGYLKLHEWLQDDKENTIMLRQLAVFHDIPLWLLFDTVPSDNVETSFVYRTRGPADIKYEVYTNNMPLWKHAGKHILGDRETISNDSPRCWESLFYTVNDKETYRYSKAKSSELLLATLPMVICMSNANTESSEGTVWSCSTDVTAKLKVSTGSIVHASRIMNVRKIYNPPTNQYPDSSFSLLICNRYAGRNDVLEIWK